MALFMAGIRLVRYFQVDTYRVSLLHVQYVEKRYLLIDLHKDVVFCAHSGHEVCVEVVLAFFVLKIKVKLSKEKAPSH